MGAGISRQFMSAMVGQQLLLQSVKVCSMPVPTFSAAKALPTIQTSPMPPTPASTAANPRPATSPASASSPGDPYPSQSPRFPTRPNTTLATI